MTNIPHELNTHHTAHTEKMRRFLAQLGVPISQGAELMRLVRKVAQAYDGIMAANMRDGQLSLPRMRLLLCLFAHEADGQECLYPTQLSQALSLSKNTISAHLRALEEMGFLMREVDPEDLRQFRIRLADTGRDFIRRTTPQHMAYMDELAQELTEDERQELQRLLGKLLSSLHCHGGGHGEGACAERMTRDTVTG